MLGHSHRNVYVRGDTCSKLTDPDPLKVVEVPPLAVIVLPHSTQEMAAVLGVPHHGKITQGLIGSNEQPAVETQLAQPEAAEAPEEAS